MIDLWGNPDDECGKAGSVACPAANDILCQCILQEGHYPPCKCGDCDLVFTPNIRVAARATDPEESQQHMDEQRKKLGPTTMRLLGVLDSFGDEGAASFDCVELMEKEVQNFSNLFAPLRRAGLIRKIGTRGRRGIYVVTMKGRRWIP